MTRRQARAELLGELGHQNMTLTNDHSQNNEMIGNHGCNSVKAVEHKGAEGVGIEENATVLCLMPVIPCTFFSLQNIFLPV